MPSENVRVWPESGDLGGTELTLALPGTPRKAESGNKRSFRETVDLNFGGKNVKNSKSSMITNGRVVGWPPVKTARRKYVKVAVDGAAYLRKVDLEMYDCYQKLFDALENMFQGTICNTVEIERSGELLATYEDKDGDWMLVGDVPWMMFVDSCKRMRLMKTVDALGLAPR